MDTILNLSKVKNKMSTNEKISTQKINSFFEGAVSSLNKEQIEDIISIVEYNHNLIMKFLEQSLSSK